MKKSISVYLFLSFLLTSAAYADSDKISLPFLLGSNQILVLGEEYGQEESAEFVLKTVSDYVSTGGCLKVGLEISSEEQETLESAMRGEAEISDINIKGKVDSASYRQMLGGFSNLIQSGSCLSVYALDTPPSVPVIGDAWMEKEVVRIVGDSPVLILTSNMRAVKEYDSGESDASKLLAQRLRARTYRVSSVLQHWKPGYCATRSVELVSTQEEKAGIYVKESIGEIAAAMPEKVSMVTDGVLVWSCPKVEVETRKETVKEADGATKNVIEEKYALEVVNRELVERDEERMKKIRGGIKHNYPVLGMTKEEAIEALGDPTEVHESGIREDWVYQCYSEDGYDYNCFILNFKQGVLADFKDQ